jgi:putative nucleotidyltransferase with HDIG domain
MKIELKNILDESHKLTVFPSVVTEILQKVDDPTTTPAMFQQIIIKDPLVTAKTLKLANSAYYGFPRAITTISEAVVLLGLETLRSLIIAVSAYNMLNKEVKGYRYQKDDFWHHSLSTALLTQKIAKRRHFANTETYFVGGILHDIGKLLLDQFRVSSVDRIDDFRSQNRVPEYLAEKSILGYDHAEVGAALADTWKFPALLIDIIRFHHSPLKVNSQGLQSSRSSTSPTCSPTRC